MKKYVQNAKLMRKPSILKELEKNFIDITELHQGFTSLYYPFSNEVILGLFWTKEDEKLANYFIELGEAGADGRHYSFFIVDKTKAIEYQPIVHFGDEGTVNLVAKDFNDWLRLMAFGSEPSTGFKLDEITFSPAENSFEDDEEINWEDLLEYRKILQKNGLPLCDFEKDDTYAFQKEIVQRAQVYAEALQKALDELGIGE